MQDRETVDRLLAGEAGAWDRFTREMRPVLVRAATSVAGRDAAEDVAQKVLQALLENDRRLLRSFRGLSSLSTWLIGIARRQALLQLRHERPRTPPPPPPPSGDPLEDLLRAETGTRLATALESLAPRERLLLVLHSRDGLPYAEIAAFLGVSPNSVGPLLDRARERLRAALQE